MAATPPAASYLQHRAFRERDDTGVERLVAVDVEGKGVEGQPLHILHLLAPAAERLQLGRVNEPLHRKPCRRALEYAAYLDRVERLRGCEAAHGEAATRVAVEQPHVPQPLEGEADRRPGHAEARDQRQFGHALSRRELAAQ